MRKMTNDEEPRRHRMASPEPHGINNGRYGAACFCASLPVLKTTEDFAQTVGEAACRGDYWRLRSACCFLPAPPCSMPTIGRFATASPPSCGVTVSVAIRETKPKGGLDLTTAKGLAAGADGNPVVVPGKPDESRLIDVVSGDKPEMPKNGKPPLAAGDPGAARVDRRRRRLARRESS